MADAQWGKLAEYAEKMAQIQGSAPAKTGKKGLYIFASDHGVAEEEGISRSPRGFTLQRALEILSGGAAINAIAERTGWDIILVDAGISGEIPPDVKVRPGVRLIREKIMQGSANFVKGPAMTESELEDASAAGEALADDAAKQGYSLAGIGEFGAGSAAATAAILVASGFLPEDMIAPLGADSSAGAAGALFARKKEMIISAVNKCNCDSFDPEALLLNFGAPNFAMIAGFISGLNGKKIAGVLDGFPVSAAAWTAWLSNSKISKYLFAGHLGAAPGHRIILEHLMLDPVVDFAMSPGEGAGAAIGGQIIELASLAAERTAAIRA